MQYTFSKEKGVLLIIQLYQTRTKPTESVNKRIRKAQVHLKRNNLTAVSSQFTMNPMPFFFSKRCTQPKNESATSRKGLQEKNMACVPVMSPTR
jgi:hypothetical protein